MPIHNPPHPGDTLRLDILPELGISVTELARHIGYARPHLSKVLNGHAPIRANWRSSWNAPESARPRSGWRYRPITTSGTPNRSCSR